MKGKICKICNNPYKPISTLSQVCSFECFKKFNSDKEIKKRVKEMKVNVEKLSDLESIAKKAFQAWVRKRDEGKPCISCGAKITYKTSHGSHYFDAGKFSGMIFEEDNCHASCVQCNTFLHGNKIGYRLGLVKRYGEKYVNNLELNGEASRNYKYTRDELIGIAKHYKSLLREK